MLLLFFQLAINAQAPPRISVANDTIISNDTIKTVQTDSLKLKYPFLSGQYGGLYLKNPAREEIEYDPELGQYVILEKIGNFLYKRPIVMTREAFKKYRLERDISDYFKSKINATNSKRLGSEDAQKNLLPTYYVNSDYFNTKK